MNRKISVFILLILIATSFKYRTKTVEANLTEETTKDSLAKLAIAPVPDTVDPDFETFVSNLQHANEEFAKGNPAEFKSLWSKENDITVLGKLDQKQVKGWKAVETSVNNDSKVMRSGTTYSFENIMTQVGSDMACLIQAEHYQPVRGKAVDLRVTILLRKEADSWKIIHRHAENLKLR